MRIKLATLTMVACVAMTATAKDIVKGKASYYSDKLHGRKMSNGEPYHRDSMTCANLKYPLGTMLKVRNPINNKEVIVKVTDRGPFTRRFIIDLSKAAARELGILRAGFCQVEITPYHKNEIPYRSEPEPEEVPELDLHYTPAATYPDPVWQQDSIETNVPEVPQTEDSPQKQDEAGSGS